MNTTRRPANGAHQALPLSLRSPAGLGANDGAHRAALAFVLVGRWLVAAALLADDARPDLSPIYRAIAVALALNSADALDALAVELTRWCELASADPFDPDAVAPLMLAACDASALVFHAARDTDAGAIVVHEPDPPPRRSEAVEGDGQAPDDAPP